MGVVGRVVLVVVVGAGSGVVVSFAPGSRVDVVVVSGVSSLMQTLDGGSGGWVSFVASLASRAS